MENKPRWAYPPRVSSGRVIGTNVGWIHLRDNGDEEVLVSLKGLADRLDSGGIDYPTRDGRDETEETPNVQVEPQAATQQEDSADVVEEVVVTQEPAEPVVEADVNDPEPVSEEADAKVYEREELEAMGMPELREIGRPMNAIARKKKEIIDEILIAQASDSGIYEE